MKEEKYPICGSSMKQHPEKENLLICQDWDGCEGVLEKSVDEKSKASKIKGELTNIMKREYDYKKEVRNLKEYIANNLEDKTNRFNIKEIDLDIDGNGFSITFKRSRIEYHEIIYLDKIYDGYHLDTIQATTIDEVYRIKIWFYEENDNK